ncbi:hypothetical protein [Pedosphaera parvula]|uniref:SMI1/KNR4 family protein n=1 Tax=Pedosphaera parvula (strain Ellin514) TaxID=320771 RepID=B9XDH1_PEDPL|nr:hypothetical protein [Pedosphaera parvula]EEF62117.1 conserved hypothetical protein [Pedosphaera parvula Ellin514]
MKEESEYFAAKADLPDWFEYPPGFIVLVKQGIVHFAPWRLVNTQFALNVYPALRDRYKREIFPIAHRGGSDDVVCLEKGCGETVKIINAYTSSGHENMEEFDSFWSWFRYAIDDMIDFNS